VVLELVYLSLKVVDHVVSVCEHYFTVLHLLLKILQQALDLQVLHSLEFLILMGLNLGSLLSHLQKDKVPT
jgi:hypothetical protein